MSWLKWSDVALAVLRVNGIGAAAYGSWHWKRGTKAILVRFDAARAESRGRLVRYVPSGARWQGRFRNYVRGDGMLVPLEGGVPWEMPDSMKPYYRGKLTSLSFEFVNPR